VVLGWNRRGAADNRQYCADLAWFWGGIGGLLPMIGGVVPIWRVLVVDRRLAADDRAVTGGR